ncbi:ABC transporter ATP-binding protein [Methanosarcina sp. UBA289]|uniref:ABC transporter ATP-binding protein n=1 Tax=Methanosarcina sp. UBA289 TaxID=1915574 RepID=UPI0025F2E206|nr:ATP-binding cassette domain-containing protein [Methanosarcina sp. UBA289]
MLELAGVSKTFQTSFVRRARKVAVDCVSFRLKEGEILGLVGESGCGKSTLGRLAVRLLQPSGGRIFLDGKDVTDLHDRQFREYRQRIQIIFQHPENALDPHFTLMDSILEAFDRLGIPKSEYQTMLERLANEVSLPLDIIDRYPNQVSGGEIQRAVLTRVFAFKPRYLVLDEPTSMLDVSVQAHILQLLKKKAREDHMGMLFISHDLEVVRAMCDRVMVMKEGRIIEEGTADKIFEDPSTPYLHKLIANF